MKATILLLLILASTSCHRHCEKPVCNVNATVTDLSSQSGCGFGFTLTDGTVLVTENQSACGNKHNPVQNFQLADGMTVMIAYEPGHHSPGTCSAGTPVHITCITAVSEKE